MDSTSDASEDGLTPEVLLSMATTFTVLPYDPYRREPRLAVVLIVQKNTNPESWCISSGGSSVLAFDGRWEEEPGASNRSRSFLACTRWPSAREAITFAVEHLRRHPSGFRTERGQDRMPRPTGNRSDIAAT